MYIADSSNCRIRKVTVSTGIISTVVGTGTSSFSGDGGVATSATLYNPYGVALDASGKLFNPFAQIHIIFNVCYNPIVYYFSMSNIGNVYITDTGNQRIRKVTLSTGIITTIAGTGTGGYNGDGSFATSASLYNPFGVILDASGIDIIITVGYN